MSGIILIAGAGELGSRYLQGMAKCKNNLDIFVLDISKQSLKLARKRWEQTIYSTKIDINSFLNEHKIQHKVTFSTSVLNLPKQIDIVVVATNADVRSQIAKQIVKNTEVRYWIFEKVLAQSIIALDEILSIGQNSAGAWTNIPRRMMFWHKQIREKLRIDSPLRFTGVGSDWGLACNTIHYLDLVSWWTGETLYKIDVSGLDLKWIKSKREGFYEITGEIAAVFSGGSTFSLEANSEGNSLILKVFGNNDFWEIDEQNGLFSGRNGIEIPGKNEMQSLMTTKLVDALIEDGDCELPKLSESVEMHRVYLVALLEHWNNVHESNDSKLPIT